MVLPPAIFLMGPTASGKTDLAVDLAERLPLEIISVDSALVYRRMNIGTAKPDPRTLARAPHHLIDIVDPTDSYSAASFREDALALMADITASGRIPFLVGGTMLYFRALEKGLAELPESDPEVRARLQRQRQEYGLTRMHERLAEIDPRAAARIDPNDPQRILRALEVHELSGKTLTELQAAPTAAAMPYRAIKLIRAPEERTVLHQRIAARFDQMLEAGFAREVESLMAMPGFDPQLPAMRAVGYRQMIACLAGDIDARQMREQGIAATRQLAKRQLTWLRKEIDAKWVFDGPMEPLKEAIKKISPSITT